MKLCRSAGKVKIISHRSFVTLSMVPTLQGAISPVSNSVRIQPTELLENRGLINGTVPALRSTVVAVYEGVNE